VARNIIVDGWCDMLGTRNGSKPTSQGAESIIARRRVFHTVRAAELGPLVQVAK